MLCTCPGTETLLDSMESINHAKKQKGKGKAMYKDSTIASAIRQMHQERKRLEIQDVAHVKMCISSGNRKIGRVMNVSLPPIMTCHNCHECKYYCYDIKACIQYPNTVINARMRNLVILEKDAAAYFNRIREKIRRRRKNLYFRWHVSGDIPNMAYFLEMVSIAREFPKMTFWTYTKYYDLVNEYCRNYGKDSIPENFTIMFSEWDGMPLDNPFGFPVFSCKLKDGNKNHKPEYFDSLYKCPGNCDMCKDNKLGCIGGMDTYCDEH